VSVSSLLLRVQRAEGVQVQRTEGSETEGEQREPRRTETEGEQKQRENREPRRTETEGELGTAWVVVLVMFMV